MDTMSETDDKQNPESARHFLFQARLPLESETCWFILLSVCDLVLTFLLLRTGIFREVNPVAEFVLFAGGLKGFAYFKFAMVAFVTVLAQIIARRRLETARTVLRTAIVVQFFVAVYSATLLAQGSLLLSGAGTWRV